MVAMKLHFHEFLLLNHHFLCEFAHVALLGRGLTIVPPRCSTWVAYIVAL